MKNIQEINTAAGSDMSREKTIVRTSIIGIIANVFLAAFKAVIGLMTNSIAIILDAINNISDAGSSLITIIGTKLAGREPDKKHPFGHGRVEYISALAIGGIVLYAGVTSLVESVKKIIHPVTPDYAISSLIIVAAAVLVKIGLGLYVKSSGERVNSDSLINSGKDALLDAVISAATLAAALVFTFTGMSLEAYLGALISLAIIKAGIEMLSETVSKLLGEPGDIELLQGIKATVRSFPQVKGAYDLILHNYGPDTYNGSVHIEVEDSITVSELDELNRAIAIEVYKKHNVILTAIGVYSIDTKDPEVKKLREEIAGRVLSHEHAKQIHGFYYNKKENSIRFDVVIGFDAESRRTVCDEILKDLQSAYPGTHFQLAMDIDYGEICKDE
jgi:cation diffusion facilitator family transporter